MNARPPAIAEARSNHGLQVLVSTLFFVWGFSTVLVDTLIPRLKALFTLSYAEAMLTQLCFFAAYFFVSIPASQLLARIGYLRAIVTGLLIMAAGCLLFVPASRVGIYGGFLFALFVLASGIALLQVTANPLMAVLGPARSSHSRLVFAQFFNSLGTTLAPHFGAALILGGGIAVPAGLDALSLAAARREQAQALWLPFAIIAAALALLALLFWQMRRRHAAPAAAAAAALPQLTLLVQPRVGLAVLSIFLYVGAEVTVGSLMINYLMQGSVLGLPAADAARLVSLYWMGAMLGRLFGGVLLRRVDASHLLTACALGAVSLLALSALSQGALAAYSLIAVGLCNSIMFPTLFTLGIEGLADRAAQVSGLICMAIVGGAVIPVLSGWLADHAGLSVALICPLSCYAAIAAYGRYRASGAFTAEP